MYAKQYIFIALGHLASLSVFIVIPLSYLYVVNADSNSKILYKKDYIHFLPFAVIFLIMSAKMFFSKSSGFIFTIYGISLISLLIAQNIVYVLKLIRLIKFQGIKSLDNLARLNSKDLKILKYILFAYLTILIIKVAILIAWIVLFKVGVCITLTEIFFGLSFVLVNTAVLVKLSFPDLLSGNLKYQTSGLNLNDINTYISKLESAINENKMYLNPLLTMDMLSKQLKISKHNISQIINEKFKLNFNEYINQYRISDAKKLIMQNEKVNILEITYEVGFNSKSTFNTWFKKITGLTPSEFKKTVHSK